MTKSSLQYAVNESEILGRTVTCKRTLYDTVNDDADQ